MAPVRCRTTTLLPPSPNIEDQSRLLISFLPSTTSHLPALSNAPARSRRYSGADAFSQTLTREHSQLWLRFEEFRTNAHLRTKIPLMCAPTPSESAISNRFTHRFVLVRPT